MATGVKAAACGGFTEMQFTFEVPPPAGVGYSLEVAVAEGATVEAEVEARAVRVGGRFAGTLDAGDSLVVEAGAVFVGDVKTPRLQIADGAHFKGKVDMDFELPGETKKRDDRRR